MKNIYKAALVVAFGLATIISSKASSGWDLIAGFTQQGGNSSGNDFLIDIGSFYNWGSGASVLYNGETWNLSSELTAQGFNLANAQFQWGVIGDANSADTGNSTEITYTTTSGFIPDEINGSAGFTQIQTPINTILGDFGDDGVSTFTSPGQHVNTAASGAASWNNEMASSGTTTTLYHNAYGFNPDVTGTGSPASIWVVFDNNSSPTNLGTFTLSSGGVLTFNIVSTTPPRPRIVNVTHVGNTSTIYFTTTNGFTYTLHFTNTIGLLNEAAISNWPALSTTVTGNDLTNSLTDTTTSTTTNRFYAITVH
jgi:hypothetical protein